MNIFFDLDGTILDSKPRLYHLFQFLVPESKFSFNDYWNLKKEKVSHSEILVKYFYFDKDRISQFIIEWMALIEAPEWISYDKPFEGISEYLSNLQINNELYIVTARQSKDIAMDQLKEMGLKYYFKDVFVTCQKNEKYDLINNRMKVSNLDWIIGDTGKDIITGKKLGIKTAAVLSGFLSEGQLITYCPDIIVNNVTLFKPSNKVY